MRLLAILLAAVACTPPPQMPSPPNAPVAIPLTGAVGRYVGRFDVGGESFGLAVDTGSELLAVASPACAACGRDGTTAYYKPGRHATNLHRQARGAYDEGTFGWTGDAYIDTVGVDQLGAPITMFAMTDESSIVVIGETIHADGIIGLAGSGATSWLDALARTGVPDVFAMHKCASSGTLWLGGYDGAGSAQYVASDSSYNVALHGIDVGSAHVELPPETVAAVDSGAAGLVVPQATFDAITAELDRDAMFRAVAGGSAAAWFASSSCVPLEPAFLRFLPPLTIELDNGLTMTVPASESYAVPMPPDRVCPGLDVRDNYSSIGDLAMRHGTVVFDRGAKRIGFAPPAACPTPDND
ncbi:MAG TPA: pepsin-like aspartic protease [Kofleriaceae bacterium]|nr:pepsin-like aspartic protease [Kofleriaceae bacterium]